MTKSRKKALEKYKAKGKSEKEIASYMRGWDMVDKVFKNKGKKK